MGRRVFLLVGGLVSLWAVSLPAQEAVLGQQYGLGVHAYFSGDYPKAFEQLTAAIQGGSRDPRTFYFRGLSYLQLGRGPEAVADFKKGAELESTDINKFYNVSKSLERVQGAGRMQLESYRMQARMTAVEQAERFRKARYEAIQREESRVVREMTTASERIETSEPAAEAAADDPFAAPAPKPVQKSTQAGKKPAEAAVEEKKSADAAKEPAKEPAKADESDLFATGPAKPPAGKKGGLLGAMGKALGKAVGGKTPAKDEKQPDAEEKPAAKEKPVEKQPGEKKTNSDDPFAP